MAAEASGSDGKGKDGLVGYLQWMSRKHPQPFAKLMEKLLPLQLTGKDGGPLQMEYRSKDEVVQRLKERGLPVPQSLMETPPVSTSVN